MPVTHAQMANAIRFLSLDAVEKAKSGHPGMPMGMADVATVLFTRFLKFDPEIPGWPDRDRFVLSAGHGSMLLYSLLHLTGYPGMTIGEIERFRQLGSKTPGHPEHGHTVGVETTTGPLGQGLGASVGMALAERMLAARFGAELVDHHTYVVAGDGCLMEGISHEAIDLAGHLRLGRLIVLWDDNGISIDGPTSLATSTDQVKRFAASGWHVQAIDGHDPSAIARALRKAKADPRPSMIACRTTIGFGAPTKAGTEGAHGSALGPAEVAATREALGWPHAPFVVPAEILATWRKAGRPGARARAAWEERLAASPARERFADALAGRLPAQVEIDLMAHAAELVESRPNIATRKASENALNVINAATDLTVGGSADLTHSNFTITKGMTSVTADDFTGRYIRYGVREHGMAAAMNGLAVHGGFVPYGGTFLVFADYARGAIRLAALMKQRVIYVLTHDSIGVGEDGPTHQPVEHLASLRAMPNLIVMRPADAVETAECYAAALAERNAPSALALSRQNLPTLRLAADGVNRSARGAYVLREARGRRAATLLATGSEAHIAVAAAETLATEGVDVAVVSMPSWELFERQPQAYQDEVLGDAPRIGVEAALRFGWDRWIGPEGVFVGMAGFGESAPGGALFAHFGLTAEAVAAAARAVVGAAARNAA
ncbi:MAG TPA: transketolase [Caulobacteraceae bacterium]|nr:transketolase [Caulobacteraceae bacterium]